jgi:2-methylisocitrate lyase-like PEP mutase family enzyme
MARETIDELLTTGEPLALPGVYDGISGILAAHAGFRAVFLSGYSLAATRLGRPDLGLLTQTEVIDAAGRLIAAVDVPVIVDIDTGYGNAFNVERTVDELVRLGAAGCFLEDQVWPKRCGHMEGKRVVPLEEFVPKLRAALRARGGTPFHVTARTDARAPEGLDEAIERALAFSETGADAVFVEAPQSIAEMDHIRHALPAEVTLVANMVEEGKTPLRSLEQLGEAGYQMVVFPIAGVLASTHALREVYGALKRDGATRAVDARMLSFEELNTLLGLDKWYGRETEWLG